MSYLMKTKNTRHLLFWPPRPPKPPRPPPPMLPNIDPIPPAPPGIDDAVGVDVEDEDALLALGLPTGW